MFSFITIIVVICLLSVLVYLLLMLYYSIGLFRDQSKAVLNASTNTFITVVICFRDEEKYLGNLLKSIAEQSYPASQFEIILYNDSSKDESVAIIKNAIIQYKNHNIILRDVPYIKGHQSPKKLAISDAASQSNSALIAVTDADCVVHPEWLSQIENCYQKEKALMIAGPVTIKYSNSLINDLQYIEQHMLSAVSAGAIGNGSPIMCSGANMAFDRAMFLSLNPYNNNQYLSSGDDMFLLLAMSRTHSKRIYFLTDAGALVSTEGKTNIKSYLNQRVRWASKSKSYDSYGTKIVAFIVLLANICLMISPFLLLCQYKFLGLYFFVSTIAMKQLADMIPLFFFSKKIGSKINYFKLLLFQFPEALFTCLIAFKSIKGSYIWKERKQYF